MRQSRAISSPRQMEDFAKTLSTQLRPGDALLLNGPLGAGKTFLAQALIKSLDVDEQVTSPTFVMVKSYRGKYPINHIDAYRLLDLPNPAQAFEELDIDSDNSITIVEWGAGFDITGMALTITIEIENEQSRTLTIEGPDSRWSQLSL